MGLLPARAKLLLKTVSPRPQPPELDDRLRLPKLSAAASPSVGLRLEEACQQARGGKGMGEEWRPMLQSFVRSFALSA